MKRNSTGFTLVEILVVVSIIGVLMTIGVVSFVSVMANSADSQKATKMVIISNALEKYYQINGEYPSCEAMSDPDVATKTLAGMGANADAFVAPGSSEKNSFVPNCGEATNITDFAYVGEGECAIIKSASCLEYNLGYKTQSTEKTVAVASKQQMTSAEQKQYSTTSDQCPTNFITVPGDTEYGTEPFCVMKYEAKNVDGKAISQAAGIPWGSRRQSQAITESNNACVGCQLMTEAQWMTIAKNIALVPLNWTTGVVGLGQIYSGNSIPSGLPKSADSGDNTGTAQRTLKLSNGETIWDFAGNVGEWTTGTIAGNKQPGLLDDYVSDSSGATPGDAKEWNTDIILNDLPASSFVPSFALDWDSTQGIGQLRSNYNSVDTTTYSFSRGGSSADIAGIYYLDILKNTTSNPGHGFRVTK